MLSMCLVLSTCVCVYVASSDDVSCVHAYLCDCTLAVDDATIMLTIIEGGEGTHQYSNKRTLTLTFI